MSFPLDSPVLQSKVSDLCEAILKESSYLEPLKHVNAFLENDVAREQYRRVTEMGQSLQQRQQQGEQLLPTEISEFEKERNSLMDNDTVRNFVEAQQALGAIHAGVGQWVGKTLELGRLPEEDDFSGSGCCGGGGCDDEGCDDEGCGDEGCGCSCDD